MLEAMRNHLLRPRTFVGVLNLFSNALDAALHYPDLVQALRGAGPTGLGDSAVPASQASPRGPQASSVFAASGSNGASGGEGGLNPDAVIAPESLGYALQITFNDTGMLNVVVSLCGREEDVVSLNALRLGVLILEGGNRHAQSRLLDYFLTHEGGFFHNVRGLLHKNLSWVQHINAEHQYYLMKRGVRIEETKRAAAATNIQIINALAPQLRGRGASTADSSIEVFTASKSYVSALHGENKKWLTTLRNATQVSGWARVHGSRRLKLITFLFRLLQLFCEGHFAGLQNYLRVQYDNLHSANVILETMTFMEEISTFVTPSNYRVLSQGFELLSEVCQGPCRFNQEALIDYGACRVIRHTVDCLQAQSGGDQRELTALLRQIRGSSPPSSLFLPPPPPLPPSTTPQPWSWQRSVCDADRNEVFVESVVMNRLGDEEAAKLRVSISNTLLAVLEGCREAESYRRVLRQVPLTSVAAEVQYACNPATVYLMQHNEEEFEKDNRTESLFNRLIYLKSVEPYAALEGVLDGVETLLRSSAAVARYLGSIEIKRADGLERVYFRIPLICLSLTQNRKDELLWSVDRTSRATKLADFLHKSDEVIFAVERNHGFRNRIVRWTRFAAAYHDEIAVERPSMPRRVVRSLKVFYNDCVVPKLFPYELEAYDVVSMTLAVLANTVMVAMEGGDFAQRVSHVQWYGNRVVSVLCVLQVVVCGFMCAAYLTVLVPIHFYHAYKSKQRFAAGRARVNVDLAEVYANLTVRERWASFLTWFNMQFRLLLLLFAILSCAVSHYFAAFNLMLVVYRIPTLRTFISAITMNGKQLLLTSFLGVIMLYLFSIVGFLVFSNQYNPDGEGSAAALAGPHMNCESLLQCFVYIVDQGLRAGGGVGDVMEPWAWGNSRMLARLAYDMLFYALVSVVFLNILFGIIIDTFGQMRDEKREKETDMHGFCFICGLDADTLEKAASWALRTTCSRSTTCGCTCILCTTSTARTHHSTQGRRAT
ncbi:putative mitochondrial insulin receptor,Ryanodine receptor [Leptomonas pyrrhocoris]|uniref:Putative mitochondrial insulin receptor,Ryanodine receptor n=1 Tax=Leptomonas pyrrhocoris TaxID=157538 RepID=A0A0N0DYC0_LEPPY|nr:putative mitochondrial insulin receptor,Ryanodine receptor [Leptomonas pyrrhocoris]KPA83985.1 putative mitochondrial insulin receptor,Ryanodine receptor [Leptomonas pyrrhocoris]|eukprot:XP_015662424.1 putative mitochondrial insulin receptor,Ryanodine receptor [Leptomonas pyrrhocoris]